MIDDLFLNVINPPLLNGRVNEAQAAFQRWQQFERDERQAKYQEYRDYYDGSHDTTLTQRQKDYLQIKTGQTFDANYCPIVVDALAERFIVKSFEVKGEVENVDATEQQTAEAGNTQGGDKGWLWQIWQANRMDAKQTDVHTAVIRDGDTFAIVEWDNDKDMPVITHELAYDGTEGVSVVYQNEKRGEVWFAFKKWQAVNNQGETHNRLNIYTDNAIYKFTDDVRVTSFSRMFTHWKEYRENEGDEWPIPWVDRSGEPLGVPVVHFKHKANGYNYGLSRLDNVIPMQNALNKSLIDLLAAGDVSAFRILTMLGGVPVDDDGNELKVVPGGFVYNKRGPSEVAIGHIPGEDLRPFIAFVDSFIIRIAQMSRTPLSYFQASRQVASDDTQEANESGLVSIAEQESTQLGNSWEDVMTICRKLHNAFGSGVTFDETADISTVWDSFKRINEEVLDRQTAETNGLKSEIFERLVANGVARELAAEMAGYSQEIAQRLAKEQGTRRLIPANNSIDNLLGNGQGNNSLPLRSEINGNPPTRQSAI